MCFAKWSAWCVKLWSSSVTRRATRDCAMMKSAAMAEEWFRSRSLDSSQAPLPAHAIRVAQWNVLADYLSDAFPHVDPALLTWAHRGPLIAAEVTRFVRGGFVVALEEVDRFDELLAAVQSAHATATGAWRKKAATDARDGVALLWDDAVYACVGGPEGVVLGASNSQVALLAHLCHRASHTTFCMAATHLKAKRGFEVLRETQARVLCDALAARRKSAHDLVIVAGDFNDEPQSLCAQVMRERGYASAYEHGAGAWTTSKWRQEVVTHVIDYIWYAGPQLRAVATLAMPSLELVQPTHLPVAAFPSDHLSIGAVLSTEPLPPRAQATRLPLL